MLAKTSTISQRCNWLLDVARKLHEQKEDFVKTITISADTMLTYAWRDYKYRCDA